MSWEELTKQLAPLIERKQEIEKHAIDHPAQQSGEDYHEWMELRDKIASLTFKRDWEFEKDRFEGDRE